MEKFQSMCSNIWILSCRSVASWRRCDARFWPSREEPRQDLPPIGIGGCGEGREPATLAEQSRWNPAWWDRASGISRECSAVFSRFHRLQWNENRGTSACRARKRREEDRGSSGLIEILIAGLCRPRAQYPYVNRECRLASSFNDARISIVEDVASIR